VLQVYQSHPKIKHLNDFVFHELRDYEEHGQHQMWQEFRGVNQSQHEQQLYKDLLRKTLTYVAVAALVFSVATLIPFDRVVISKSKL